MQTLHILGTICVAGDHAVGRRVFRGARGVVVGQLLDALLASARHAFEREAPIHPDREQRLHIQLGAGVGNGIGDAAATAQRLKIVHHEQRVHVVARLFGPCGELGRRKALLALTQGLVHQQCLRHARKARVNDVELEIGVFLPDLVLHQKRNVVASRKPRREAQIHRGHAAFGRLGERPGVGGNRHLRRSRLLARTHASVEILGRHRLIQVVKMLLLAEEERELDKRHAFAIDDRERQVAARVDNQVALGRHGRDSFLWKLTVLSWERGAKRFAKAQERGPLDPA